MAHGAHGRRRVAGVRWRYILLCFSFLMDEVDYDEWLSVSVRFRRRDIGLN